MKLVITCLLMLMACNVSAEIPLDEHVGAVHFATSCSSAVQPSFNRGVALLHDFWYKEAQHQFEQIAETDPNCAMAQWGLVMSEFHQIWNHPNEKVMARGWAELRKAQSVTSESDREREYLAALSAFFAPGKGDFQPRVEAYAAAMAQLYSHYPDDIDVGAFYALALMAESPPDDTSLNRQRQALAVLKPLFEKDPKHPGVVHYIIHACDTPSLASEGLAAAEAYGSIAPSAPHAVHMPGHIFARLGMWQQDIDVNEKSVAASQQAEARHQSGAMDQFHSYEFLLYAYLQDGEESRAKEVIAKTMALMADVKSMPDMDMGSDMSEMASSYHNELTAFYYLETRDWRAAAALKPQGKQPNSYLTTYWARIIADGHLHQAKQAKDDLQKYDALIEQVKKGKNPYFATSTSAEIWRRELEGWSEFAAGYDQQALDSMRKSADLQDKIGQGEVDIPAREMLADMLLELKQPEKGLVEYDAALAMSPNRLNGLFNAGMAAEATGNKKRAAKYYASLLKATNDGAKSSRSELAHAKAFLSSNQASE